MKPGDRVAIKDCYFTFDGFGEILVKPTYSGKQHEKHYLVLVDDSDGLTVFFPPERLMSESLWHSRTKNKQSPWETRDDSS